MYPWKQAWSKRATVTRARIWVLTPTGRYCNWYFKQYQFCEVIVGVDHDKIWLDFHFIWGFVQKMMMQPKMLWVGLISAPLFVRQRCCGLTTDENMTFFWLGRSICQSVSPPFWSRVKYPNNDWMDCHKIWFRRSWSQEDKVYYWLDPLFIKHHQVSGYFCLFDAA